MADDDCPLELVRQSAAFIASVAKDVFIDDEGARICSPPFRAHCTHVSSIIRTASPAPHGRSRNAPHAATQRHIFRPMPSSLSPAIEAVARRLCERGEVLNVLRPYDAVTHFVDPSDVDLTLQYLLVVDALNFCFWPAHGDDVPKEERLEYHHLAGPTCVRLFPSVASASRPPREHSLTTPPPAGRPAGQLAGLID